MSAAQLISYQVTCVLGQLWCEIPISHVQATLLVHLYTPDGYNFSKQCCQKLIFRD